MHQMLTPILYTNPLYYIWNLFRPIPNPAEKEFGKLLYRTEDFAEELEQDAKNDDGAPVGPARLNRHQQFTLDAIRSVKAEMGVMSDTTANRMVVRKKLLTRMEDRGMRPSHIHMHLDMAIAVVMTPDRVQINGQAALRTDLRTNRINEYRRWGGSFGAGT